MRKVRAMLESGGRPRRATRRTPILEALEGRRLLATLVVSNTNDAGPDSLRDAVEQANLDAEPDTIEFAPGLRGTITLSSALPDLSTPMALAGPGAAFLTLTPGAGSRFRIFTVTATAVDVTISGLTLASGRADEGGGIFNSGMLTVANSTLIGNSATGSGGGIFNDRGGVLTVTNSIIQGNLAENGSGGGISSFQGGTLTVASSLITNNSALFGVGGGISNSGIPLEDFGTLVVIDSVIRGNSATNGGGIHNDGMLSITRSTVGENSAGSFGGGIGNQGALSFTHSTLSGNSAGSAGGGIYSINTITIVNSTLSGNSAGDVNGFGGGGIANLGALSVTNSTLSGNSTTGSGGGIANGGLFTDATLRVSTSILANPGSNLVNSDGSQVVSGGRNLFSDRPDVPLAPSDLVDADPRLGPLADNGGPTMTHALLPGSPAIDAAVQVEGVTTDQRGVPRPQGPAPDIGAFEVGAAGPTVTSLRRYGYHGLPTRLVLNFDSSLDPARATDPRNYRLLAPGRDRQPGTADDRPIRIAFVRYDELNRTVTLRPRRPLPLPLTYRLTVTGTPPGGLTDAAGRYLAGAGVAGTDYVATFGRESLVLPHRPGVGGPSGPRSLSRSMPRGGLDHRQHPGADRLGQLRPGLSQGLQVGRVGKG